MQATLSALGRQIPELTEHRVEYLVICLASLAVSGLTLFSGFGLGTVLTPVMAIFFPIETAVAVAAVVHFANNPIIRNRQSKRPPLEAGSLLL